MTNRAATGLDDKLTFDPRTCAADVDACLVKWTPRSALDVLARRPDWACEKAHRARMRIKIIAQIVGRAAFGAVPMFRRADLAEIAARLATARRALPLALAAE